MTRVIITGGTGLIGRRLVPLLSRNGYEVIILTRNPQRHPTMLNLPNVQLHIWDAITPNGWAHLIHNDTILINLAGQTVTHWRWTATYRRMVLQSRVDATRAIVQAVASSPEKPLSVLQASSVDYYGSRGELSIGEITTAGTGWRAEVCKRWESESEPLETMGVRRVVMRIGNVLERGKALSALALGVRMISRQLGDGRQWVSWVHNADVASAMLHLMTQNEISGAVNLVAPTPVTNREFMASLAYRWQRPFTMPIPTWALRAVFGEMADTVLDSQRIYPPILLESGYTFRFPEVTSAINDLLKQR